MENYNLFADLLNKYSQLTPWVQALIGLGLCAVPLGAFYFFKETVAVLVAPLQKEKATPAGEERPEKEWQDKYYRDTNELL